MMQWSNPRQSRLVALGLLAALVVLVATAIGLPAFFLHRHYDTHLEKYARLLASATGLNAQRPAIEKAIADLKAREIGKYFLKGATPALASAELQDIGKLAVEGSGGRLLSVQAMPHKDEGGWRQVSANFQVSANIQNLKRILYALESRQPYLFVDGMTIRAQVPSGYKPVPGMEPDLFVQIEVSAFVPISKAPANATTNKTITPATSPATPTGSRGKV